MERARVTVGSLSDNSLTKLPQLVELLGKCVSENTILCLSRSQSKFFAITTTCRHFGSQVFKHCKNNSVNQLIVIVSDSADANAVSGCLHVHSSFSVLCCFSTDEIHVEDFSKYHVLITNSKTLDACFSRGTLTFERICLIVFNECHIGLIDDSTQAIMELYKYKWKTSNRPLILAVTTVLSTMYIEDSHKLEEFLLKLSEFYCGSINVDRAMLSQKFSSDAKLKEQMIICSPDVQSICFGLEQSISQNLSVHIGVLIRAFPTILSSSMIPYPDAAGAAKLSHSALVAVDNVLSELGPFCAAKLAENFVDQIDQHYSCHMPDIDGRKMLAVGSSALRSICQLVETYYTANVISLEDLLPLIPAKVNAFLTEFKKWMPSIDFKITPAASIPFDENKIGKKSKSNGSDDTDDDDDDDDLGDFTDMSSDSTDGGAGKGIETGMPGCTPIDPHTFRRHRRQANIRMMRQILEGTALSGLVVVKTPYEAFSLAMLIDEVCKYDGDLFFLKVGHYASLALEESSSKSLLLAPPARLFLKYQSNVLHRFRQRRINVLVTTDLHGTSVTLPPINHVVRLGVPFPYESYIGSKSFCQTHNSVMTVVVDQNSADSIQNLLQVYRDTENVLLNFSHSVSANLPVDETSASECAKSIKTPVKDAQLIPPFSPSGNIKDSSKVTADNAIMILNRYCAKLPSDVFTRLTSLHVIETVTSEKDGKIETLYRASITLPIISPLKAPIVGSTMSTALLALKSAAVEACRQLHQQGELDDKLNPVTFEVWKCEDLRQEELQLEASVDCSTNKPSTSGVSVAKRKQTYSKKFSNFLTSGPPLLAKEKSDSMSAPSDVASSCIPPPPSCRLFQIKMRRYEAPVMTLVDRAYDNACCPRHYGFVTTNGALPALPNFPVFTRYCDLDVTFEQIDDCIFFSEEELELIRFFHRYVFHRILRVEKDVLFYQPERALIQAFVLPLFASPMDIKPRIDWDFIKSVKDFVPSVPGGLGIVLRKPNERFEWNPSQFEDAVVYRSYCGFVAHDLYYVVNHRYDYSPKTPFPSDQYDDFVSYYEYKYRLTISNTSQPLLDVDHTTAHLNMVLPRRCSGKSAPSSEEENAQRLWFVPELCGIHPFPASMWHKAACLPTIFYRLNSLLVANETLTMINTALGIPNLTNPVDGVDHNRSLLEYSQLRTHQMAAIANQAAEISHWTLTESLLQCSSENTSPGLCTECMVAKESVVFKTLWLYFKRDPEEASPQRLSCLICHGFCVSEFHAIAHLRHRHSWLYTQPWSFKPGSACLLCQAMTAALTFSQSQLQPCELPISAINCPCEQKGLCCRLTHEWNALRPKIGYLAKSTGRPPNMCDILTAMTASNANDMFSYERLETVGDSFLKFTVTAYLYCSCPGVEEGKLTYMRSRQVCNLNLYYRGRSRDLAERMIVSKFEPTEAWLPPGYVCLNDDQLDENVCNPGAIWKAEPTTASVEEVKPIEETVPISMTNGFHNSIEETSFNGENSSSFKGDDSKLGDDEAEERELNNKTGELPLSEQKGDNGQSVRGRGRGRGRGRSRGRGRGRGGRRGGGQLGKSNASKSDDSDEESNEETGKKSVTVSKPDTHAALHTHQSLSDKNIADCVEALIAAYLVTAGHEAALKVITWFGIKVLPLTRSLESGHPVSECVGQLPEPSPPLIPGADPNALMNLYHANNLQTFESLIGYHFRDKAYLVQAFCHASYDLFTKQRLTDSYQRLELLGDAILDYLITRHMYELHTHYSPGVLTDLRSALVNNNIFSSLAVRWSFHRFLLYASPGLFNVVVDFVNLHKQHGSDLDLEKLDELEESGEALECPKVLGDVFESVAGAIYLDSGLSLETVWLVYYRMLKPVIDEYTANIPKSPVRELLEREPETARFLRPERTIDGRVKVIVNVVDKGQFTGVGRNFRLAKNAAARRALRQIKSGNN